MGHQPEASPTRGRDSVELRYLSSVEPAEWLRGELTGFYDGDESRVDELFDNLEGRWEQLADSIIDTEELIAFEVGVSHDDHTHTFATTAIPHPVELLWVLCHSAEFGDTVEITHHHLDRAEAVALRWPFGIDDAIVVTSPDLRASTSEAQYPTLPPRRRRHYALIAAGVTGAVLGAVAAHLTLPPR